MDEAHGGALRASRTFLVLVGLVLVFRLGTFHIPPTWDGAMGVWPAAIEISSDWDLGRVLSSPTFLEGGPNVHTLSLVTLLGASLLSAVGPESTYFIMHALGVALAVGLAFLVADVIQRLGHRTLAILAAVATVGFPLVMSQTAYLYTELPSAYLAFLAIVLAFRDRPRSAAVAILFAILVKPLAVVAVPAVALMTWFRNRSLKSILWPSSAVVGVVPPLSVPQPQVDLDVLSRLQTSFEVTRGYITRMPEVFALLGLPFLAALVFRRKGASEDEWVWFWVGSALFATFLLFFLTNGVATIGWFFLPRYATLLVPMGIVFTFLAISRLQPVGGVAMAVTLILVMLVGVRGPLAWGHESPAHPLAERSLAFVERVEEERIGLERLAALADEMPVYYDHQAHYAYSYPELLYFNGTLTNGTAPSLEENWGANLVDLPDRFAMLVGFPFLGGERMRHVELIAIRDPRYSVRKETLGSTRQFPLELIIVEKLSS